MNFENFTNNPKDFTLNLNLFDSKNNFGSVNLDDKAINEFNSTIINYGIDNVDLSKTSNLTQALNLIVLQKQISKIETLIKDNFKNNFANQKAEKMSLSAFKSNFSKPINENKIIELEGMQRHVAVLSQDTKKAYNLEKDFAGVTPYLKVFNQSERSNYEKMLRWEQEDKNLLKGNFSNMRKISQTSNNIQEYLKNTKLYINSPFTFGYREKKGNNSNIIAPNILSIFGDNEKLKDINFKLSILTDWLNSKILKSDNVADLLGHNEFSIKNITNLKSETSKLINLLTLNEKSAELIKANLGVSVSLPLKSVFFENSSVLSNSPQAKELFSPIFDKNKEDNIKDIVNNKIPSISEISSFTIRMDKNLSLDEIVSIDIDNIQNINFTQKQDTKLTSDLDENVNNLLKM